MPGPLQVKAGGHDPAPGLSEAAESKDSGFTEYAFSAEVERLFSYSRLS